MFKIKYLLFLLILSIIFAPNLSLAVYNTVTWGPETNLYFSGVAKEEGGDTGITINVYDNTYLHSYILDTRTIRVTMYPGSSISLKSLDRKIFTTNIDTADTVCTDEYSVFTYSTPSTTETFTIALSDDANCPAVAKEIIEDVAEEEEEINVENLDHITTSGLEVDLLQKGKTHFVLGNVVETIAVESIGSTQATISLSTPVNKNLYLKMNKAKNIDTDADGYRDLQIILADTSNGQAGLLLTKMNVVKFENILPGQLVKTEQNSAVYYYGEDSQRYVFPNDKIYYSWYENFDNIQIINDEEIARLPIGGLVTYKPGSKLVTFTSTKDVCVVDKGGKLRKLKDEQMAIDLYGTNWNAMIDDINDAFFASYSFGEDLMDLADYSKESAIELSPTITIDKDI